MRRCAVRPACAPRPERVGVDARVDVHPVLGETVRVALTWRHAFEAAP